MFFAFQLRFPNYQLIALNTSVMGLLDLPTELLLEINTHLSSPVDIFNLSAISKESLCVMGMARSRGKARI